MSDDLINSVKQLIQLGKGDPGRLEYILDMLTTGRVLPISDQKYLQNIIPLHIGGQDQESIQRQNEHLTNQLQNEIKNLNQRLVKLERRGFESYVGKKAIFFFVTVFVGWNALSTFVVTSLGAFLPDSLTPYLFPLVMITNSIDYPIVQFVFTAMMYAWVFIGFIHLARLIKSRKISN